MAALWEAHPAQGYTHLNWPVSATTTLSLLWSELLNSTQTFLKVAALHQKDISVLFMHCFREDATMSFYLQFVIKLITHDLKKVTKELGATDDHLFFPQNHSGEAQHLKGPFATSLTDQVC